MRASKTFEEAIEWAKGILAEQRTIKRHAPRPLTPEADAELLLYPYDDFGISEVRMATDKKNQERLRAAEAEVLAALKQEELLAELTVLAEARNEHDPELLPSDFR